MLLFLSGFYSGEMRIFFEKQPFFQLDMAGLGKYSMGRFAGLGFIGLTFEITSYSRPVGFSGVEPKGTQPQVHSHSPRSALHGCCSEQIGWSILCGSLLPHLHICKRPHNTWNIQWLYDRYVCLFVSACMSIYCYSCAFLCVNPFGHSFPCITSTIKT